MSGDGDERGQSAAVERVCLLVGRSSLPAWVEHALATVERETDATVSLVVRTDTGGTAPAPAERLDLPAETGAADAETVYAESVPAEDGPGVAVPEDVVERIAAETDVVFHNGVGILRGSVLTAPEHGVLSYHHGDVREYRGVVTHFWNYLHRDETGGVTVLQLTEDLDAGGVVAVREVSLAGCRTWRAVETRKQWAGEPLLAEAVESLSNPAFEPTVPDPDELGPVYRSSDVTPAVVGRYLLLETAKTLLARARKLRYLWNLRR